MAVPTATTIWSARARQPGLSVCRSQSANFRNDALIDGEMVLNGALRVERYGEYLVGEGWRADVQYSKLS